MIRWQLGVRLQTIDLPSIPRRRGCQEAQGADASFATGRRYGNHHSSDLEGTHSHHHMDKQDQERSSARPLG